MFLFFFFVYKTTSRIVSITNSIEKNYVENYAKDLCNSKMKYVKLTKIKYNLYSGQSSLKQRFS